MRKYHSLTVSNLQKETADSMRMALSVADEDRAAFDFLAGQHLPMQITIDDKRVRRTYSICSAPGQLPLEVGIRVQPGGQFSEYVANELKIGDMLEVMPPFGRFHSDVAARKAKTVLMFA
ncbi:MAG: phenylacetic acid degradation protein, partial [Woeseia sp.]|nr:phenylacetic acid degradation protein [Woeseia sp.]